MYVDTENNDVVFALVDVVFIVPLVSAEPEPPAFQHQATKATVSLLTITSSSIVKPSLLKAVILSVSVASP